MKRIERHSVRYGDKVRVGGEVKYVIGITAGLSYREDNQVLVGYNRSSREDDVGSYWVDEDDVVVIEEPKYSMTVVVPESRVKEVRELLDIVEGVYYY